MSAIASFTKMPISKIGELRDAAVPKKRFFGGSKDGYRDFLRTNGTLVADYGWSGFVLATLLPFLDERGIDLMKSAHDDLSTFLANERHATTFVLAEEHRRYLPDLEADRFSASELRDYFNEFNGSAEDGIGEAMLDGIASLKKSIASIDVGTVVLLSIG